MSTAGSIDYRGGELVGWDFVPPDGSSVVAPYSRVWPPTALTTSPLGLDTTGCFVAPGLVDIHTHAIPVVRPGVMPDEAGLVRGVTTVIDAGSVGAAGVQLVLDAAASADTRVLAWLNLAPQGLTKRGGELREISDDFAHLAIDALRRYDVLIGLKARLSSGVVGESAMPALTAARAVGDATGLPIMVHIGDSPEPLTELLPFLVRGDVVTHTFTPRSHGLLNASGTVIEAAWQAKERGVIFDIGAGAGHLDFSILETAVNAGFFPDTFGSDLSVRTVSDPDFGVLWIASIALEIGMPLDAVIEALVTTPRGVVTRPEVLSTDPSQARDVSVFRWRERERDVSDSTGARLTLRGTFEVTSTLSNGRLNITGVA